MVKDEIKMKDYDCETFDKKRIALVIKNATLGDELECSLKEEKIINKCENCSLISICIGIDKLKEDYIKGKSTIIKKLLFNNVYASRVRFI